MQASYLPIELSHSSSSSPFLPTLTSFARQGPRLSRLPSDHHFLPLLPLHRSQNKLEEVWLYRGRTIASCLSRRFEERNRAPPRIIVRKSMLPLLQDGSNCDLLVLASQFNYLHRVAGRLVMLASLLHALLFLRKTGWEVNWQSDTHVTGIVAVLAL